MRTRTKLLLALLALALVAAGGVVAFPRIVALVAAGDSRELRKEHEGPVPPETARRADLLVLALDGIGRDLLYEALRAGELPELAALLGGGSAGSLPHAHLEPRLLSVLPSTTLAAWASIFAAAPVAEHGVSGNEFFVRERREMAAPAPVSIEGASPMLAVFTEGYASAFLDLPTVYERMREREPAVRIWVGMSQFYRGADRLLLASRTAIGDALNGFVTAMTEDHGGARAVYGQLDEEVVETLEDELEERPAPDVLTLYLPGADLYAHGAKEGPDAARHGYLREVLDPLFGRVRRALDARGALADRWVVVLSDHGHTAVLHDDEHALSVNAATDPPAVLARAGFRVRPFEWKVGNDVRFDAVLAYQGAIAYLYLADRSTCARPEGCDWTRPPRFEEDVLAAAEAFRAASCEGALVPEMRDTLDLVLARRPRPGPEPDLPYEVYVGGGALVPVERWLQSNPRPEYVALASRLRALAEGPRGERAGDVLLMARNHDRSDVSQRYYFSRKYRSWHGSASRTDSEVPLVVAHPRRAAKEIEALVQEVLGPEPRQWSAGELLVRLRDR